MTEQYDHNPSEDPNTDPTTPPKSDATSEPDSAGNTDSAADHHHPVPGDPHPVTDDPNSVTDVSPIGIADRLSEQLLAVIRWLGTVLYRFNKRDIWRVKDSVEGTVIIGGTGSGKTSGSGRSFAVSFIKAGFGGLVCIAKTDEVDTWKEYCRDAGVDPEERLVTISPEGPHRFNLLSYEFFLSRLEGGTHDTRRLVNLFVIIVGVGNGEVSRSDPYWQEAQAELMTHAVDLVCFASGRVENGRFVPPPLETGIQLAEIAAVVKTAPRTMKEAQSRQWMSSSACGRMLMKADEVYTQLSDDDPLKEDLKDTMDYWLQSFPGLSEKTRSVVVSSFTSKANDLLRQPLRQLFCTTTTPEATPVASFRGKIILLNLPVKKYGKAGVLAQVAFKTVWQHAAEMEQRWLSGPDEWRPVFLWADEVQHFVTPEDVLFQATARSQLVATVYLTQNISNLYHALGGSKSSATDALLGSLQMKVFHANGDPATNEWAERLFGSDRFRRASSSSTTSGGNSTQLGVSHQDSREPIVPGSIFTMLTRGGGKERISEAIIAHAGRRWESAKNFLLHRFKQTPNDKETDRD